MTPPQYNDEIDELLNELNNSLAIADHYDTTEDRTYELQAISKAKQRLQTLIKQAEVREPRTFNRFEVINHLSDGTGREVIVWKGEPFEVKESIQDDGRTLKIFLTDEAQLSNLEGEKRNE